MSFVKPFLCERETVSNLATDGRSVDTEAVEDTETVNMELQPKKQKCSSGGDQPPIGEMCSGQVGKCAIKTTVRTSPRKSMPTPQTASAMLMKYSVDNDRENVSTDPTDLFFNNMAATIKKFSPQNYQNIIKTKIFSLVSE